MVRYRTVPYHKSRVEGAKGGESLAKGESGASWDAVGTRLGRGLFNDSRGLDLRVPLSPLKVVPLCMHASVRPGVDRPWRGRAYTRAFSWDAGTFRPYIHTYFYKSIIIIGVYGCPNRVPSASHFSHPSCEAERGTSPSTHHSLKRAEKALLDQWFIEQSLSQRAPKNDVCLGC